MRIPRPAPPSAPSSWPTPTSDPHSTPTFNYTVEVGADVDQVTVTAADDIQAAIKHDDDTVTAGHQIALGLPFSQTTVTVTATANGETSGYTININRNLAFVRDRARDIDKTSALRCPMRIWSDGDALWVADCDDDKLCDYDLATVALLCHLDN